METIHIPLIPAVKKPEAFQLLETSGSDSMHHAHAPKDMHAPRQQQFVRRFEDGQII